MLKVITLLLVLQLVGESIHRVTEIPLPGPVIGMILLFIGLLIRSRWTGDSQTPEALESTASGLLNNLSLLFVPAGVGVVLHLALIGEEWIAISAALVGSTILTIAVTALVMQAINSWHHPDDASNGGEADQ